MKSEGLQMKIYWFFTLNSLFHDGIQRRHYLRLLRADVCDFCFFVWKMVPETKEKH